MTPRLQPCRTCYRLRRDLRDGYCLRCRARRLKLMLDAHARAQGEDT